MRNLLIVLLVIVAGVVGLRLLRATPNQVGQRRRRHDRRDDDAANGVEPVKNRPARKIKAQKPKHPASDRIAAGAQQTKDQPVAAA